MIRHNNFRSEKGVKEKAVKTVFTRILSIMLTIGIVCPSITPLGAYLGANATEEEMAAEIMTEYDEAEEETEPAEEIIDEEDIEITEEETVSEEETAVTEEENNSEEDTDLTEETIDEEKTGIVEEIVERIEDTGFQMMMAVNMIRILANNSSSKQYSYNFTKDTGNTAYYTIINEDQIEDCTGKNWNWINTDNNTYYKGLSLRYSGEIEFTAPVDGTLRIVLAQQNKTISITSDYAPLEQEYSGSIYTVEVKKGNKYTIKNGNYSVNVLYLEFTPLTYTIQNIASKRYISYNNNDFVQTDDIVGNNSKFQLEPSDDGHYYIRVLNDSLNFNNYLTGSNFNSSSGTLTVNSKNNSDDQKFDLSKNSDGSYTIVLFGHGEKYAIDANAAQDGVSLYLKGSGNNNRKFNIVKAAYTPNTRDISTDLTLSSSSDRIRLNIDNSNVSRLANGYISTNVEIDGKKFEVKVPWSSNGIDDIIIDFNTVPLVYESTQYSGDVSPLRDALKQKSGFKVIVEDVFPNTVSLNSLTPLAATPASNTGSDHIKIEARVIFGDYKDDDNHVYAQLSGDDLPKFNLKHKDENSNSYVDAGWVSSEMIPIVKTDDARKDWCYQYRKEWDVPKLSGGGYYVELANAQGQMVTISGKQYKVYYLTDDRLGHPGENNDSAGAEGPFDKNVQYPVDASDAARNTSGAIYIYLDPVQDWQLNGATTPDVIDSLSTKKRWDGHNLKAGLHPLEKIQIQLQRWDPELNKWFEFNTNNHDFYLHDIYGNRRTDENGNPIKASYEGWYYYEKDDGPAEENKKYFIKVSDVVADVNTTNYLKRIGPDGQEVDCIIANAGYNGKKIKIDADKVKNALTSYTIPVDKQDRLRIQLDYDEWNNVVLSYSNGNRPAHFSEGYYFSWGELPYGEYRVIETQSFYDTYDDNVFDEKIDRDTSQEYYYMEFPPSRDSSGVLHIQNFTKDMVLHVEKEWYDDSGNVIDHNNTHKKVHFEVYRSSEPIANPTIDNDKLERIYIETTENNGQKLMKTTDGYDKLLLKDGDSKYYYYIREVGVDGLSSGQYQIMNANDDGFIRTSTSTKDKPVYYADYESGDDRKFIIQNKPVISIKVEKKWYTDKTSTTPMTFAEGSQPNAEFEIYMSDRLGTPEKSGNNYVVGDSTLISIGNAVVNKDGFFEIIKGDTTSGDTSKIVSNKLHMYGTPEKFDGTVKGVFEPNNKASYPMNSDGYFDMSSSLWVKPSKDISGTLILTFKDVQSDQKFEVFNKVTNKVIAVTDFSEYQSNSTVEISYPLIADGNKQGNFRLLSTGGSPKLTSAVFYPYNYYYIREKGAENSETFELLNGDANGFVKFSGDKYYTDLVVDKTPSFIAKNVPKMELTLNKEWYADEDNELSVEAMDIMNEDQKTATFEIYRSAKDGNNEKVSSYTLPSNVQGITKNSNNNSFSVTGNVNDIKITGLDVYKEINGKYYPYSYYIKEVKNDNYKLLNDNNEDGFIDGKVGVVYTSADKTFTFQNQPVINVTVKKVWDEKADKHENDTVEVYIMQTPNKEDNSVSILSSNQPNNSLSATQTNYSMPINVPSLIVSLSAMKNVQNSLSEGETVSDAVSKTSSVQAFASLAPAGEKLEINSTSGWEKSITLPAFDNNGNPYYYYAVESGVLRNGNDIASSFDISYSADEDSNTITITNKEKKVILPETGGIGKWAYIVLGVVIMLTSCGGFYIIIFGRKRKKDKAA